VTARPSLSPFFAPRSVAVIGASDDPSKIGGSVLANLRSGGFPGPIVPVSLRRSVVQGLPAAHSILAVEGDVDLAVVAVAAPAVLPVLKECVAKGVRAAVVISAGFRESGPEGREREAEMRAWLREQPLRILGPNCLGWIRPSARLNATFAPGMPRPGPLGFFSHSGALCTAILDWSREHGIGFSLFASLGVAAIVQGRRTAGGFHVSLHDVSVGRVLQSREFPFAGVPPNRDARIIDSVATTTRVRERALRDSARWMQTLLEAYRDSYPDLPRA